jgi:hypothetical protein
VIKSISLLTRKDAELWYDDRASLTRALAPAEARALHAGGARFIGRIKTFTVEERFVIGRE